MDTAKDFSKGSIAKVKLKKDIPFIRLCDDNNSSESLRKVFGGISFDRMKEYFKYQSKVPSIILHNYEYDYYTLKSPLIIESVKVYEDNPELSILGDRVSLQRSIGRGEIKGNPLQFREVSLDEKAVSEEKVGIAVFRSNEKIITLPVFTYIDKHGKKKYAVRSPKKSTVFWEAKRKHGSNDEFVIEPDKSFLRERYKENRRKKLDDGLTKSGNQNVRKAHAWIRVEYGD